MNPNLFNISWKVPEEVYRADPSLSYSTIARFAREGFSNLSHLFDRIETPSLTFGSAVDALITGGQEEFDKAFIVAEFPEISDNLQTIAKTLFSKFSTTHRSIDSIDENILAEIGASCGFYANEKYKNYRVKLIKEGCQEYYNIMYAAQGKTILSTQTKSQVDAAVNALKTSPATQFYFQPDSPFDASVQRFYQLKFKATFFGIDYRCMLDEVIVDHTAKTIQPIDLKTTSHPEWEFFHSFIQWSYHIQARLYYRILKANIEKYDAFQGYTILPYKFIVVNKNTLIPLVWEYNDTFKTGTLTYGKYNQIICKDPFDLGRELSLYLTTRPEVPVGINKEKSNSLTDKLKEL